MSESEMPNKGRFSPLPEVEAVDADSRWATKQTRFVWLVLGVVAVASTSVLTAFLLNAFISKRGDTAPMSAAVGGGPSQTLRRPAGETVIFPAGAPTGAPAGALAGQGAEFDGDEFDSDDFEGAGEPSAEIPAVPAQDKPTTTTAELTTTPKPETTTTKTTTAKPTTTPSGMDPWEEGFEKVDGGDDQQCQGAASDWENPFRIHHNIGSVQECKELCKDHHVCVGIGYDEKVSLCELWTTTVTGSRESAGKQCFRYHPDGFAPVKGGTDFKCVAIGGSAEEDEGYHGHVAHSLYECKVRCHKTTSCLGVDYDTSSNNCRLWARPPATADDAEGRVCMKREPQGFKPMDGGLYHRCALADDDDDESEHSHMQKGDHSVYECKSRCAHAGSKCKGVNFNADTRECEMWTLPINASKKVKGKEVCFTYVAPPADSLYCASLMVPWTDEPKLLANQLKLRVGIFACDEFAVFSHPIVKVGHLEAKDMGMDLHVEYGGEYNTALNTPIFVKFWKLVVEEARFNHHGWVVKADPDTVFFPERLRYVVRMLNPVSATFENGVFLNNCQLGMHGPLEVISAKALETYATGYESCWQAEQEDVYIENCFRELKVEEINNFDIMAEKDCWRGDWHQYPDWDKCNTAHASFHPFKNASAYNSCWKRAMKADQWPPAELHDLVG